ncbi:MAG: outer membrane lipoprotein-sorting protein [Pseudomonadota bacterium]
MIKRAAIAAVIAAANVGMLGIASSAAAVATTTATASATAAATVPPTGAAAAIESDARAAIAQAWQHYQQDVQTEQELVEVQIVQAGQPQQDKLLWRRIQFGAQGQKVSIKFVGPAADAGLGLLVERDASAGDQIWLRLPSWSSGRKILGNRETKYFAETAVTFEDSKQLIGEQTAQFDYRYQGAVIVATPKPGVVSGYARREISLNGQGVPSRIVYFDGDGQQIKTLSFEDISFPAPGRWRANRIVIRHQQQNSQTVLKIRKRQFNLAMSDILFTLAYMAEAEHAKLD